MGCTPRKDLDIAVEEHEDEAEGEGMIVGEGFGKVTVQESVEGTLQSAAWAAIACSCTDKAARKECLRRVKQSI